MRTLLVTCLLLVGFGEVRADAKGDAEAVIRKHLKTVFTASVADTMTPDGKIYVQEESYDPTETSRLEQNLMMNSAGSVTTTAKTLTVVVDPATKLGWFAAPLSIKHKEYVGEGTTGWKTDERRVIGVVVDQGGWKIAAVLYGRAISDKELMDRVDEPGIHKPKTSGDNDVVKAARAMFGSLVKLASASASAAIGTAASEVATTRPAALKLAAGWDKLKLNPVIVHAHRYGKVGIAHVHVEMGVKKGVVLLNMLALLVEEAEGWRWVMLGWDGG